MPMCWRASRPLRVLMVVAVLGAALAVYHAFSTALWPVPLALGLYLLTSIGGSLYAAGIQRFVVSPNEQAAETPYMIHNIEATRRAFNLAAVRTRNVSGDAELTREDIERNADTIKNVRLWDHQPLLDTFGQIQELRTYYDFVSVDNDRYTVNGQLRQVMLSARELNPASLPNRTWINEHLTFTHGYGITLGPVNEVTPEGLPILFVKDIPPQSSVPADIDVKEPSIYFGELTNNYVLVNTKAKEFHYSKGEQNVETTYTGTDGVRIGGLGRKLLFSLGFQSLQILFSNDITPETPRALSPEHHRPGDHDRAVPALRRRPVSRRVVARAPVLDSRRVHDHDAVPVFDAVGGGLNYIRNSVKVVIDAYNGTTDFFLADPRDPLAQMLARAFPGLLKPLDAMPADLRQHLRYPETIFAIQAAMYSDLPHDQPGRLLQQGRPVGNPGDRHRRQSAADAAVLHRHAAAGRGPRGVHPDAAVHAGAQGQPGGMDDRAIRPGAVRTARGVRVPEAENHLRPASDHRAHQSGPGDLAADYAVESAGIAGDPGHAARHSGRRGAALRAAALPQSLRGQDPGAEPGDRRLSGSDRRWPRRSTRRSIGFSAAGHRPHAPARTARRAPARLRRQPATAPAAPARRESGGARTPALRARHAGAARRQLGAVRRRDPIAWRNPARHVEMTPSRRTAAAILWQTLAAAHAH